ncbi:MAG: 8-oxoguanine deaminase [Burkholderiales bacterium]|jgi:8-oxoguanine deaminase|nr:8-oxoguanine deaminase [Burkholderiales bacterium]
MKTWIKSPLAILANNADNGIVIHEDKIIELVAAGQTPITKIDNIIDAREHVVIPGLINTHHHYFQTLTRAFNKSLDKELFDWLSTLYNVWQNLTPHSLYVASKTAMCELLLSGCTTSADHHYLFPRGLENAIDIQVSAAKEIGIRSVLTRGSMNLSAKDGGLPPDLVVQTEDKILLDCERLINLYHDTREGAMIQIALAPCSPFSVSKSIMLSTAKLANKYNVRTHTHLSEALDEDKFCQEKYGCRPIDYLEEVGWLNDKTWLAHAIHYTDGELARLGRASVGISHCPSSNMILSSGICKTIEARNHGCKISIGVDGSASNDHSNMMMELRAAFLLQRLNYSSQVSHLDILHWGTLGGASVLGRTDIGELAVGKQADIAMYKLNEIQFYGADNPLAALIICGATRADKVMVKGKLLVEDSRLVHVDMDKLRLEHNNARISML